MKELVAQYGAIKPGEKPSRTLSVPKRTDEGRNVSAAVRTVLEARVTPENMVPTIEDAIESGDFSYETITDKASLARAKSKIRRGYQEAYDDFRDAARRGNVSKDQFTLGLELYNQAANAGTEEGMMFSLCSKRCCAPCAQTRLRLRAQKKNPSRKSMYIYHLIPKR